MQNKTLQWAFGAWKGSVKETVAFFETACRLDVCIARQAANIGRLNATFKKSASQDAAEGVKQIFRETREVGQSAMCGLMRSILKIGRRYRPLQQAPVLIEQGEMYIGKNEAYPILAQSFASAERATARDFADFRNRQARPDVRDISCQDVPDIMALAYNFATLKRGKAAGFTKLPAEVYSGAPLVAAQAHFPLVLRQVLRAQAPMEWTGGQVAPVPKPGKPATSTSGWRSILLLDPAHKAVAKTLRPALLRALDGIAKTAQCGGRKGYTLELPKSYVRVHLENLHACRRSGSVLFLDGKTAYYSTVRNILHDQGGFDDSEALLCFVEALHPDEGARRLLYDELCKPGILTETHSSTALCNYVRSTIDHTWFALGLEGGRVFQTATGTSPGAPLADLLYLLISTRFLSGVQQAIKGMGHVTVSCSGHEAPIPGWADDYAIIFEATSAAQAVQQLVDVLPQVYNCLGSIGVELNLMRGKTEAILALYGPGSRALRGQLLAGNDSRLPFHMDTGVVRHLCLTSRYVHLGGIVTAGTSYVADLKWQLQDANGVFARLHKVIFRNSNLSIDERVRLFHSLVLSKVQQAALTWFFRTKTEHKIFQTAVDKWHRRMVGPLFQCSARGSSSTEIQRLLAVLSPGQILDVAHVRWLTNIAAHCCPFLRDSLETNRVWISQTKASLHNMFQATSTPAWSIACSLPAGEFLNWAGQHREELKRFTQRFSRKIRDVHLAARDHTLGVFRARTILFSRGGFFGTVKDYLPSENVACPECGAAFANKSACASHRSKVHGQAGVFARVFGTLCQCCSTEFHTTSRLRLHLRKVPSCGCCYAGSDVEFTAKEFVGDEILSDKPAVKVAFARPFWATLKPAHEEPVNGQMTVHVAVKRYHLLRSCKSFSEVVRCVLACARFRAPLLQGVALATCALTFELEPTEYEVAKSIIQLPALPHFLELRFGDFKLHLLGNSYVYGPAAGNFRELGVFPNA